MLLKAENMRAFIKDPDTGKMKEMPISQTPISYFRPEQHEDGRYSFTAKFKLKRRDRYKFFRSLRETFKPPTLAIRGRKLLGQACKLRRLARKEKNPIRKAYYEHIAQLKFERSEQIRIKIFKMCQVNQNN